MRAIEDVIKELNRLFETDEFSGQFRDLTGAIILAVPESWTPKQIAQFQGFWDKLREWQPDRPKIWLVPGQIVQVFPPDGQ